jgi:hypothetical protein
MSYGRRESVTYVALKKTRCDMLQQAIGAMYGIMFTITIPSLAYYLAAIHQSID